MPDTVDAYFRNLPPDRRGLLDRLHTLITSLYPDATVDLKYRMPTYHAGDGWVAIANQKQYVSLYTCGGLHLVEFKKKHPEIRTGKGCINFRPEDDLPLADIEQVVHHAIEHPKGSP